MFGFPEPITRSATVVKRGDTRALYGDLALLKVAQDAEEELFIPAVEFATPLRHGGKTFSVLGFPGGREQGRNASGTLNAMDALGLVQMNKGTEALEVEPGYSGAHVWCPDVGAFVGLVVTEQRHRGVSWCIPSRLLSEFYKKLHVTFRMPPSDRPAIHDYGEDDPNKWLFGDLQDDGCRRFRVVDNPDDDYDNDYKAYLKYECLAGSKRPRGHFVTFITHPSFVSEGEDAYELFATIKKVLPSKQKPKNKKGKKRKVPASWVAKSYFYCDEEFTVAAIGDAGDTVLTVDLEKQWPDSE